MSQPQPNDHRVQQLQSQQPVILFYSGNCSFCQKFITELKKNQALMQNVQGVQVEGGNIPRQVQSVPTLMLNGSQLLVGQQAFEWLNKQSGELEAAPMLGAKGAGTSSFSFLDGGSEDGVNSVFSMIGAQNGSAGIDPSMVAQMSNNEKGSNAKQQTKNMSMDKIMAQRSMDVPQQGPPGMGNQRAMQQLPTY